MCLMPATPNTIEFKLIEKPLRDMSPLEVKLELLSTYAQRGDEANARFYAGEILEDYDR